MLQPKRTKFRKAHKGRIRGNAKGGTTLTFGSFGLKATSPERITARQIEAARRVITRHMKRAGRVWIRVFPDVPVSKKPTEVRVGIYGEMGRVCLPLLGVEYSLGKKARLGLWIIVLRLRGKRQR